MNRAQTSSHNFSKGNRNRISLYPSCCSTTVLSTNYKEGTNTHRHSDERETPFSVCLALFVYAKTRKRRLIDMLHEKGICVSYDRVLEISANLGEAVVWQYVEDGVVCPPALRTKIFTTSAMNNIDHNPSSTTAKT